MLLKTGIALLAITPVFAQTPVTLVFPSQYSRLSLNEDVPIGPYLTFEEQSAEPCEAGDPRNAISIGSKAVDTQPVSPLPVQLRSIRRVQPFLKYIFSVRRTAADVRCFEFLATPKGNFKDRKVWVTFNADGVAGKIDVPILLGSNEPYVNGAITTRSVILGSSADLDFEIKTSDSSTDAIDVLDFKVTGPGGFKNAEKPQLGTVTSNNLHRRVKVALEFWPLFPLTVWGSEAAEVKAAIDHRLPWIDDPRTSHLSARIEVRPDWYHVGAALFLGCLIGSLLRQFGGGTWHSFLLNLSAALLLGIVAVAIGHLLALAEKPTKLVLVGLELSPDRLLGVFLIGAVTGALGKDGAVGVVRWLQRKIDDWKKK